MTEKASGAAQLSQKLTALDAKVTEMNTALQATLVTMSASILKIETELAAMATSVKASTQKRAPKAPAGTATPTTVSGEKFPANTYSWIAANYRVDPEPIVKKYFTDEQVKTMTDRVKKDPKYKPTAEEGSSDHLNNLNAEIKVLIELAKADSELVARMKSDWSQAKSEWEKKSRTSADKDTEEI